MKEENRHCELPERKRHVSTAINQMAIGFIIALWGSLLTLKQVGLMEESVSTLPFVLTAFGALLIFGGIYRFHARDETAHAEPK